MVDQTLIKEIAGMRVGNFELRIIGAIGLPKAETPNGYVVLSHGEQYSLELHNHSGDTVNFYPKIDGLSVGEFQLGPYQRATLERPASAHQRFTFFTSGSSEAQAVGETLVSRPDKGLVQVEFVPPREAEAIGTFPRHHEDSLGVGPQPYGDRVARSAGGSHGFGAGVTGMTGHSRQEFGHGRSIDEDRSRAVTITLRLAHKRTSASSPSPLPGRLSSPVPPPVG